MTQRRLFTFVGTYQAVCLDCGENRGPVVTRPSMGSHEAPSCPLPDELPTECDVCEAQLHYAYKIYRIPETRTARGAAS